MMVRGLNGFKLIFADLDGTLIKLIYTDYWIQVDLLCFAFDPLKLKIRANPFNQRTI